MKIIKRNSFILVMFFCILVMLCSCEFSSDSSVSSAMPDPDSITIEPPKPPEDFGTDEEELIVVDYSLFSAIDDKTYYQNKYLGEIFIIKDWQTVKPLTNTLTVYGKIPFTVHPNQDIEAMEFRNPNKPTVLTGFGEGWAKGTFRGEGTGGSTICSAEIKTEFRLVGGLYPAPTCTLDIDIVTKYFNENVAVHCVYSDGLELDLPMETWVDSFTDIKLPIGFQIPDQYVTRFAKTENNVKHDLSYYLYNFWGKPPSDAELALVFGDTPVQFFNTGCENVHIAFDVAYLPEGSEWSEVPPSAWDIMLTPESQREESIINPND